MTILRKRLAPTILLLAVFQHLEDPRVVSAGAPNLIADVCFRHGIEAINNNNGQNGYSSIEVDSLPFEASIFAENLDTPPNVSGWASYDFTDDGSEVKLEITTDYAIGELAPSIGAWPIVRTFNEHSLFNANLCTFETTVPMELTVSASNTLTPFDSTATPSWYVSAYFDVRKHLPPTNELTTTVLHLNHSDGYTSALAGSVFLEPNTQYSIYEFIQTYVEGSWVRPFDGGDGFSTVLVFMTPCIADGDMNLDGMVDGMDIQLFTAAVIEGSTSAVDICKADFDGSYVIESGDVEAFVIALLM
ncbi:MAG: hypothetical protein IPK83_15680 [Planctomycetes bacterium]|nr:hypothetical protein [Planctomycetota bacterium]